MKKVQSCLKKLREKFPQFDLNGINNIWILKPAALSRGRGIMVFANLIEILDYTSKENQWVAQKYIENPMIIQRKKFDIRQWVLVTDWNPLTIWFYERSYLRFGTEDYSLGNLSNRFIHLTNNSIVKYDENFEKTDIKGSMWFCETF